MTSPVTKFSESSNPYAAPPATGRWAPEQPESKDYWRRKLAMRWAALLGVAAFLTGVMSRFVRPMIPGPVHYEAIASMLVVIAMCVVMLILVIRLPIAQATVAIQSGVLLFWGMHLLGWSSVHGSFWGDMVGVSAACWVVSAIVAQMILFLVAQVVKRLKNQSGRNSTGRGI